MRRLAVTLVMLFAIYVGYLGLLWLVQRSLVFPAPPPRDGPAPGMAETIRLPIPGGSVEAFYLAPRAGTGPAPLLIFTHGNGELAVDWVPEFDEPRRWGWGALLLEYPGYGHSDGKPTEASITAAILAAYDWARGDSRIDSSRIVPYGRSLGGGAVTRLTVERPVPALILESCFTSVRAFAIRYLAPPIAVRDPFDNLARLKRYRGPLLVMHGSLDGIVPVSHGRALAAAVPGSEFHEIPCGHNDCPRSWPLVRAFLEAHGLLAPPATPGRS
ncbi:MAG TPA: alpha/beta hydrolase [Gemmatimonadales bacterium]|jgi:fermentation-respiration switch protein FrsA (DUF1100 family)|nr:alpha/beta hydrolase [Gemmatimonadales bacterium]